MATKRTRRTRENVGGQITRAAVDAYRAGDHVAVLDELGLPPWHHNPLYPDADPLIAPGLDYDWQAGIERAKALRDQLEGI